MESRSYGRFRVFPRFILKLFCLPLNQKSSKLFVTSLSFEAMQTSWKYSCCVRMFHSFYMSAQVFTWHDTLPLHSDVLIPVRAGVFMMQSQSMNDLMAKIPHTTRLGVIQRLVSTSTTNEGRTARETNKKPESQRVDSPKPRKKRHFLLHQVELSHVARFDLFAQILRPSIWFLPPTQLNFHKHTNSCQWNWSKTVHSKVYRFKSNMDTAFILLCKCTFSILLNSYPTY